MRKNTKDFEGKNAEINLLILIEKHFKYESNWYTGQQFTLQ